MTSTRIAELPGREEMDSAVKLITDNAQRVFLWDYDRSRGQLVTLPARSDDREVVPGEWVR